MQAGRREPEGWCQVTFGKSCLAPSLPICAMGHEHSLWWLPGSDLMGACGPWAVLKAGAQQLFIA